MNPANLAQTPIRPLNALRKHRPRLAGAPPATDSSPPTPPIHCAHDRLVDTATLTPHPKNPNTHSDSQIALLAKIITHQGWRSPIVVSKRSGFIVAGHGRLMAAQRLGLASVPVNDQDFATEADELAHLVADNRIAELAEMDNDILKGILLELEDSDLDLDVTGFDEDALLELNGGPEVSEDAGPQLEKADELRAKWGVVSGQLWELGDHRLLCGDSGKVDDARLLLDGAKADMMITDPPYGVAYVGKTKAALTIENDDVDETRLASMCKAWFDCAEDSTRAGAYWIATVPAGPLHGVFFLDWKRRGILRQVLVWNKDSMVMGHSEYHYKHEPILFGWRPGSRRKNPDRTRTTVWDFDRPKSSQEHPTMKPVAMWAYGIHNHTKAGDLVYEPFCGSGTTIIACEQLGRKCRALEIDPGYVAVAIQRWADATGGQPKRL